MEGFTTVVIDEKLLTIIAKLPTLDDAPLTIGIFRDLIILNFFFEDVCYNE